MHLQPLFLSLVVTWDKWNQSHHTVLLIASVSDVDSVIPPSKAPCIKNLRLSR